MNLLLDTHAFIWFVEGSSELSVKAKNAILDDNNIKYFSIVSLWEMSIKIAQGKMELKSPFESILDDVYNNGFKLCEIKFDHILKNTGLEWHHRDPFDRLLYHKLLLIILQ
jgi:PIN domain nuclease of toxin-antitoxin system